MSSSTFPNDLRQSPEYATFLESTGWQIYHLSDQIVYYKKILPGFRIVKFQRPSSLKEIPHLLAFCHKFPGGFCKLEPAIILEKATKNEIEKYTGTLTEYGFVSDKVPLLPARTLYLDFKKTLPDIFEQCTVNGQRNIKRALKTKFELNDDPQFFYENWQNFANSKRIPITSSSDFMLLLKIFNSHAKVINITDEQHQWLAGAVILKAGSTSYYYHAASTTRGQELRAPYRAIWEGMQWAISQKCLGWDFEGIADFRFPATRTPAWRGFGNFKQKFGGQIRTYIGSYSYYWGTAKPLLWVEKLYSQIGR